MDISQYLIPEHRECDTIFARAEAAAASGDFVLTKEEFLKFSNRIRKLFKTYI